MDELISKIYSIIETPDQLADTLKSITETLNCNTTVLVADSPSGHVNSISAEYNTDPDWVDRYNNHYYQYDPSLKIFQGDQNIIVPDHVTGESRHQLSGSNAVFYNEVMVPQGFYHTAAYRIKVNGSGSNCAWIWTRTQQQGSFTQAELDKLATLGSHMSRALGVGQLFDEVKAQKTMLDRVLALSQQGIILLDANTTPIFVSDLAHSINHRNGIFNLASQLPLSITNKHCQSRLIKLIQQALISNASRSSKPTADIGGGSLYVHNEQMAAVKVSIAPFQPAEPDTPEISSKAKVIVVISEVENKSDAIRQLDLQRKYQLTNAEWRLLKLFAEGHSINDMSEQLQRSPHTLRTQLKSIKRKTDSHTQVELVRLVLAEG